MGPSALPRQTCPAQRQSFLLLRFLCRYKENEVAVGQTRRFWFEKRGTDRDSPQQIINPADRTGPCWRSTEGRPSYPGALQRVFRGGCRSSDRLAPDHKYSHSWYRYNASLSPGNSIRPRRFSCRFMPQTAKYLACGWCAIIAEVLCSGTISMVSVKVTPIASGRSR
jgi:hypothetical protein